MCVHDILEGATEDRSALFRQALLTDLRALAQMLATNALASDVIRIGVEQEMFLVDVKDNFFAAARHGLKAQLTWVNGKHHPVDKFIREQLLPLAASGLTKARIDDEDIDRYLGVIRQRIEADQTGSRWTLSASTSFPRHLVRNTAIAALLQLGLLPATICW